VAHVRDFDWDIEPEDGYPASPDDANEESEVIFKYNFTGTLSDILGVTLYQNDCVSAPDASLAFINSTTGDELDVELDIIQETISNSVHTSTSTVQPPSSDSASA
jgi:hypothetical protein